MHHRAMNRVPFVAAAIVAAGFASAAGPTWTTSLDQASKLSKQTGLPVLALFTGSDWCSPCMQMEKKIFETEVFASWAKSHVVLLRLDYPKRHKQPEAVARTNMSLLNRYQVGGFPLVLFLTPSGQVLNQYGYSGEGPSFWTKNAELLIKAGTDKMSGHR